MMNEPGVLSLRKAMTTNTYQHKINLTTETNLWIENHRISSVDYSVSGYLLIENFCSYLSIPWNNTIKLPLTVALLFKHPKLRRAHASTDTATLQSNCVARTCSKSMQWLSWMMIKPIVFRLRSSVLTNRLPCLENSKLTKCREWQTKEMHWSQCSKSGL